MQHLDAETALPITPEGATLAAMADTLLSTQQAAEVLGVSQTRVRQLILEGRLQATKIGNSWVISTRDLAKARRVVREYVKKSDE
jgi:excisionase family DNA binding protein